MGFSCFSSFLFLQKLELMPLTHLSRAPSTSLTLEVWCKHLGVWALSPPDRRAVPAAPHSWCCLRVLRTWASGKHGSEQDKLPRSSGAMLLSG